MSIHPPSSNKRMQQRTADSGQDRAARTGPRGRKGRGSSQLEKRKEKKTAGPGWARLSNGAEWTRSNESCRAPSVVCSLVPLGGRLAETKNDQTMCRGGGYGWDCGFRGCH
jgi:hypothetical protein